MTVKKSTKLLAMAGLLFTTMIWGFAFVVVKDSLNKITPAYMLTFRFTIAAVFLSIIFNRRLRAVKRQVILHGVVLGFFLYMSYLLQTIGCKYTTAGNNAFLTTFYVILVPLINSVFKKRFPGIKCIFAGIIALIGIGLMSLDGSFNMNFGDMLTIACSVGYAMHMIFIDRYTQYEDPVVLTVFQMITSSVLSFVFAPVIDGSFHADMSDGTLILGVLYLSFLSTMLAFILQNVCQKYTSPNTAALILSMEAVFGALSAAVFLGERLDLKALTGAVLLFAATIMSIITEEGESVNNGEDVYA